MTPSEKPEHTGTQSSQDDADQTSVITQSAGDDASGGAAAGQGERTSEGGDTGDENPRDAGGANAGDATATAGESAAEGVESPPPWQRIPSAAAASEPPTARAESGARDGAGPGSALGTDQHPLSARAERNAGVATPSPDGPTGATQTSSEQHTSDDNPDAEDTQKMAHPLRGMGGMPSAPGAAEQQADQTATRNSVSFTGSPGATPRGANMGSSTRRPNRGPRRASLQMKRVDPWSVLKLALVLSVALFFVWLVAVGVLYGVLDGMGVWDKLNGTFTELTQPADVASEPLISAGRVFGVAAVIGAINIVLFTALATVGAFIYNVAADFAGGIEVTLSERE